LNLPISCSSCCGRPQSQPRSEQRATFGGQTVLMVGNRGEGETFPCGYFKSWMLDSNLSHFKKI
jgi:hypothetical protein